MTKENIALEVEQLSLRREAARKLHEAGGKGSEVSMALTKAVDDSIRNAIESSDAGNHLSAFAVGGYGRAELCPHSDIDVTFIVGKDIEATFMAQKVLHCLWDIGLNIGHSVRTLSQILDTYRNDHDSWAATLEYRHIAGSESLFRQFAGAIREFVLNNKDRSFVQSTLEGIRVRHNKYGKSTSLLEPNLKKSAGGLRDLHALLWIYRASYPEFLPDIDTTVEEPAILRFLEQLLENGIINQLQFTHNRDAFEFILRTRQSLHYQSSSLNDLLDFEIQRKVAEDLGYSSADFSKGVESFMRDYFRHARKIYRLNQVLSDKMRGILQTKHSFSDTRNLDEDYTVADGKIAFRRKGDHDAAQLFRAFKHKAEAGLHFDENVHETIAQELDSFSAPDFRKSSDAAEVFRSILSRDTNVAFTLKSMNELGVLGRYLPEFGKLIGFFQHNVYHYYTADEHTLTAIENLENVAESDSALAVLLDTVARRDTLYLGILFHDIAKPISIGKHEVLGVEVAEKALSRIGFEDIIEDVAFLVRNHLKMEQIAFRRNIGDPETVYTFTRIFANAEQLKMLYLLTFADLSAVNPTVWTKWKAQLLNELFTKSYRIITEFLDANAIETLHEEQKATKEKSVLSKMPAEESSAVSRHFGAIKNELYAVVFEDDEIVNHIRAINSDFEDLSLQFNHSEDYTDVTIIARDAPFQLARFCSSLSANDANIVDANIFTRDDGVIIDRFKVFDNITRQSLTGSQMEKIGSDLRAMINGRTDPQELFERHRLRWQRKLKNEVNPNIKVAVQTSETKEFTLVEVFAPDSLGFLFRVTSAISSAGISIYFAKIATRVDGIVDTFYVLRNDGSKPAPEELDELREKILKIIRESIDMELILK